MPSYQTFTEEEKTDSPSEEETIKSLKCRKDYSNLRMSSSSSDSDDMEDHISLRSAMKWRTAAIVVSVLSTLASLIIGVVESVVGNMEDSSAALGLAFTAILDALSSAVVFWRFYKSSEIFSKKKEHIACILFGVFIIGSAVATAGKCIIGLAKAEVPDMSEKGVQLQFETSVISAVTCYILCAVNLIIAKKLSSWVIFSDALDGLVGGVIATSMAITIEITKVHPYYWFLDETVGIITSAVLLVYGLWLLVKHVRELNHMKKRSKSHTKSGSN